MDRHILQTVLLLGRPDYSSNVTTRWTITGLLQAFGQQIAFLFPTLQLTTERLLNQVIQVLQGSFSEPS